VDVAVCSYFGESIASMLVFIKARSLRSLTHLQTLFFVNLKVTLEFRLHSGNEVELLSRLEPLKRIASVFCGTAGRHAVPARNLALIYVSSFVYYRLNYH